MVASAALIPVFIVASTQWLEFLLGKLVPSVLAATSALVAAWVQIERPHERWSLYRRYQRLLEADLIRYQRGVAPFDQQQAEAIFAELLADRQIELHNEWAGLLPRSADVAGLASSTGRGG
ncbi:DUF4231 domain-containing protein [Cellulomonas sp. zg-Y766]|nr:DUF4231 domain-containing protein [Cellulomonas wangsupingiae]